MRHLFLLICLPALAQDPAAIWKSLAAPALDPEKSAAVRDLKIERDRIRVTLHEGALQLARPAGDLVFAAAFQGRGQIDVAPPTEGERHHLRLFVGKDALALEFSEAVFLFSDGTAEELGKQTQFAASHRALPPRAIQERLEAVENAGAELLPRLFKSALSGDRRRTALFHAMVKTRDKGWIAAGVDALEAEEVGVGRWVGIERGEVFDSWLSFPARDASAADNWRDPHARDDFRIRGYQIDAAVAENAEMRATARVKLDYLAGGERALLFELDSNLRVSAVRLGSTALPYFQPRDPRDDPSHGDYIAVVLPEATVAGRQAELEFEYAGRRVVRKVGAGSFFCQSGGWYPTRRNSFATRADFEMTFRNPKKYVLVATGAKVNETVDGPLRVSSWKSEIPLAVAGFAFGDYKVTTEKVGQIDVEIYANREADDDMRSITQAFDTPSPIGTPRVQGPALGSLSPAAMAKTMTVEIANNLRLFENFFGPYPYQRLAVTNIPYSYGQGWPGLLYISALSFLDGTQRNALGIKDHTGITDFFRAHETSHQWWGHRVGWKSYHDQWISEGFAQFSGNLYVMFRKNEREFVTRLKSDREELMARDQRNRVYESLGPVWMGLRLRSSDSPRAYATVIYNKGGLVLNMLRSILFDPRNQQQPDARFAAMMKDFCQTYHNRAASTEDFKAIAEKHVAPVLDLEGNGRLDWFFRQYVYGTGVAEYQFRYAVAEAGPGKWKVSGAVAPVKVAAGWKDVLRLYFTAGGRTSRLGWLQAGDSEKKFEFELPFKPERLALNVNEDTLAEIRQ